MKDQRPYKRKLLNFSVNREMQFRMVGRISMILFVCLLLSSAIYFQFANQEIGASFKMFHIKARSFLDMLLPVVCVSFVVSLICGIVATLFFPKNYAGALYRIEEDLKKVIETSDLTVQIRLRRGDQAMSLAAQVNVLLGDFRKRVGCSQQALKNLELLCEPTAVVTPENLRQIHDQLREQIAALKV